VVWVLEVLLLLAGPHKVHSHCCSLLLKCLLLLLLLWLLQAWAPLWCDNRTWWVRPVSW
jgi:hypothetical protein